MWFHGNKGIISSETVTMIFETTTQNYRLCHAVKRAFQTFSFIEKCKLLIIKWLNKALFQTFCLGGPKIMGFPPSISPKTPREQRNQREKLHPAEEHEEHEQPLGDLREEDVGAAWSYLTDARADIAQCSHRCAQGCLDVYAHGQQDDGTDEEDQEIDEDEGDVLIDAAGGDGLAVDLHGQHGAGVDDALQLEQRVLHEDEVSEDLDATRSGTRTGSDKHQQEEDDPKEGGPSRVVADEEARRSEGRDDTEERLTEGGAEALVTAEEQHQADGDAQENDVEQEGPELLVLQDGERTPTQGEEQQGEVAARQHHEDGDDHLRVVGERPDVGRPRGETT